LGKTIQSIATILFNRHPTFVRRALPVKRPAVDSETESSDTSDGDDDDFAEKKHSVAVKTESKAPASSSKSNGSSSSSSSSSKVSPTTPKRRLHKMGGLDDGGIEAEDWGQSPTKSNGNKRAKVENGNGVVKAEAAPPLPVVTASRVKQEPPVVTEAVRAANKAQLDKFVSNRPLLLSCP
jgi:hypothetical protein